MNRDWEVTKAYAEVCLSVGREYSERNGQGEECQVDVIDTWGVMMEKVKDEERTLEEFLRDGLHLAAAGNNVSWGVFLASVFYMVINYSPSPHIEKMFSNTPIPILCVRFIFTTI